MMEKKKPPMKGILAVILAVALCVVGYYGYQGYRYVKTDDAMVTGDIYKIAPKVAGKLKSVSIDDGSQVEKDLSTIRMEACDQG